MDDNEEDELDEVGHGIVRFVWTPCHISLNALLCFVLLM